MAGPEIQGMSRWQAKIRARLPAALKAEVKAANGKSADEFEKLVRRILPRGDGDDGHLADTLVKEDASGSDTGVQVSIGSPEHPYPLHLEAGHRAKDGTHVAGKPAWNPAQRVLAKRHKGRVNRAANKAIKALGTTSA